MPHTRTVGHKCLDGSFWRLIASGCRMNPFHMQFRVLVLVLNMSPLRLAVVRLAASSLAMLTSRYRLCSQSVS